jgi:hypothetical protein
MFPDFDISASRLVHTGDFVFLTDAIYIYIYILYVHNRSYIECTT